MNSSISSFKNELKVLLVVLAVIGALEVRQHFEFSHRNAEAATFHSFPLLADSLASQPGTTMILLGNSLTQNGYDMPLLNSQLQAAGHTDLHIEKIALTGSSPIEWYHNFDRNFVRRGKTPTAIVINMSPSGIADALPAGYRVGWLARETDWQDVPEVLVDDLHNFEVGGQYLQARLSMLYADRWDIRVNLLSNIIPNLWTGMNWVNAGQPTPKPRPGPAPPRTFSLLTRMCQLAQSNHAHIILVAMPAREPYDIDPEMPAILQQYRVTFLDCRTLPNLTPEAFEDGWHLNKQGAKIFTTHMATQLPRIAKSFQSTTTPPF